MAAERENSVNANSQAFFAGVGRSDITPPLGSFLGIDFFNHYARFIHDPLYAKALVLKSGNLIIAFVVVDICIMPTDYLSEIKSHIQKHTGIGIENIMLSCTHTHGAPNVAGLLCGGVDIAYQKKLPGMIVKSVEQALKKLKPAKVASGSANVPDFLLCRRYIMKEGYVAINAVTGETDQLKTNPFGGEKMIERHANPTDPGVGFLAVKGMDEQWITIMGSYNSHYAGDWHVDTVTADIYGEFALQVKEKLDAGDDFVGMLCYGTGGDVNHWDFQNPDRFPKEDFAKTKLIGTDIAEKVVEGLKNIQWQTNPSLSVQYEEIEHSIRKPSSKDIERATKIMIEKDYDQLDYDSDGMAKIFAREQLLLNEYPDSCYSAVQAIKVGNLVIGALGGEFFSETGLFLKKNVTSFNYFTVCLANTYSGYIASAYEIERGGYEMWRARSSFAGPETESKIRNKMLELISKF